jgi:hypothetical protein
MLTDPSFHPDPGVSQILDIIASVGGRSPGGVKRIDRGMYEIPHFSLDHAVGAGWAKAYTLRWDRRDKDPNADPGDCYPLPSWDLPEYGVCDSPEQWREKYGAIFEADPHHWCIGFTLISKADQSPQGGWRWHKWGEYIGTKTPQYEYIYDEGPEIEQVYCFTMLVRKD